MLIKDRRGWDSWERKPRSEHEVLIADEEERGSKQRSRPLHRLLTQPQRVPVTQEWFRENTKRQLSYAAKRAALSEPWFRHEAPEPQLETQKKSRGGTIFDSRQYRLDL